MKTKMLLIHFLLSIALISCVSANTVISTTTSTSTKTPTVTPTSTIFWITPVFSLTAEPTITPEVVKPFIPRNNAEDISSIISQIYSIKPECAHSVFVDDPNIKTKVDFLDVSRPNDLDVRWVQAISFSPNKSNQAYIACVADSPDWKGCYDHVYIKSESSFKVFEIKFDGHLSSRPIFNIIWIGNDIVAFTENSSPQVDTIYAVDITKKEYVYYSLYYGQCK